MINPARPLVVACALVTVLVVSACSSSSPAELADGAGTPGAGSSSTSTEAAPDVVLPVDVDPIDAYLATARNDWHTAVRVRLAANQEKIAACVKGKGFDYFPATPVPDTPPVNKNTEQWVQQHGYGLSAEDRAVQDVLESLDTPYGVESPDEIAYERSLSAAEDDAYTTALFGTGAAGSAPRGCSAGQPPEPRFTSAYSTMQDAVDGLNGLKTQAASAAQTIAANDDWAACMVSAGHKGLSEPADALADATTLYPQLSKSSDAGADFTDAESAQAHQTEVALALDDFDCKLKTRYLQRTTTVLYRLENDWISSHKAVLDDVIAGYRAASK